MVRSLHATLLSFLSIPCYSSDVRNALNNTTPLCGLICMAAAKPFTTALDVGGFNWVWFYLRARILMRMLKRWRKMRMLSRLHDELWRLSGKYNLAEHATTNTSTLWVCFLPNNESQLPLLSWFRSRTSSFLAELLANVLTKSTIG